MAGSLDEDIISAFQVISLLLVFVVAYFSSLYGQLQALISFSASPENATDKAELRRMKEQHKRFQKLAVVFLTVVLALFALLLPLTGRVILAWCRGGPYSTVRMGLLLVEVFLVLAIIVAARNYSSLASGITKIDKEIQSR